MGKRYLSCIPLCIISLKKMCWDLLVEQFYYVDGLCAKDMILIKDFPLQNFNMMNLLMVLNSFYILFK